MVGGRRLRQPASGRGILSRMCDERIEELLRAGAEAWRDFCGAERDAYHGFVPADYRAAYDSLRGLRPRAHSLLELGSGPGIITILADLLGFDAYGIEIDPALVGAARDLAQRFDSAATFVEGSFVPAEYQDDVELLDADFLITAEGTAAYDELGMEIGDFDIVYGYPWPGEAEWMTELVRRQAGPHTALLTYSVSDGFELTEFARGSRGLIR